MLAIARALVTSPRMVIMDEPTEGLAPLLVRQISETLLGLREEGVALLVVEQNLDLAIGVTDRLFVMDRGTIVEEFTSRAIADIEEVRRLIVLGRA
jgi:branched-chain amino acid transport system ATP-binding protein